VQAAAASVIIASPSCREPLIHKLFLNSEEIFSKSAKTVVQAEFGQQ